MAIPNDKYKGSIYLDAARGKSGFSYVHKFGHNPNASTTSTPVWSEGGAYTYLTAADYLIMASDKATDTSAGAGARTVQIYGLDTDYKRINETVSLSGFTGVTTTNQYLRIFRMVVRSAGANAQNDGKIAILPDAAGNTFTAAGVPTTTANVLAAIQTTTSQTRMCIYTIPDSCTGYLVTIFGSCSEDNQIELTQVERPEGEVFQLKNTLHVYRSPYQRDFTIPRPIASRTDIELRAAGSTSSADVSAAFDLLLIDKNQ